MDATWLNETQMPGCPVCGSVAQVAAMRVDCPRCGEFALDAAAAETLRVTDLAKLGWKISAWLRHMRPELLDAKLLAQAAVSRPPGLLQRARQLLATLAHHVPAGRQVILDESLMLACEARGWCHDEAELKFMLQDVLSQELGWLRWSDAIGGAQAYGLTAKGLLELEAAQDVDAVTGFCAMWFDARVRPFYEQAIAPAIRTCGFEPLRLDYTEYNHSIDDEIIASIRRARFVVADLTGHRGGVYYEAGFAHGLGLPVIFMLREDDQASVHFDVRQQNFILWRPDDMASAGRRLTQRIRATLGQGPLDPSGG
jgi:nucleoside 2-deoxyribosyltransferase